MSERTAKAFRRAHPELKDVEPQINPTFGRNRRYFRSRMVDRSHTRPGRATRTVAEDGTVSYRKTDHVVNDYRGQVVKTDAKFTNHERMKYRSAYRKAIEGHKREAAEQEKSNA